MSESIEIKMPSDQQEGSEAIVASWLKKIGESVKIHEPIIEISTDKVALEVPAPCSGILREVLKNAGDKVEPGDILGRIDVASESLVSEEVQRSNTTSEVNLPESTLELSPAVKRLLKQHNLVASQIVGTGKSGRITVEDVENFLKSVPNESSIAGSARTIPHSAMRLSIANHMSESLLRIAPHVTTLFEVDMSAVLAHKERESFGFKESGVKLSLTAYFVKAAVAALKAVPEVNSRWHERELEIIDDFNIGIATALGEQGLIVPVLHRAQDLNLFDIASRLQLLTDKARRGLLERADIAGGTFTISNHGVSGSIMASPIIINQPQSAILGIGKLEKRVKVVTEREQDSVQVRPCLYVTLTIDHRVLDGFTANKFLACFVNTLEKGEAL